ncbi:MAG: hypothetical protein ACR2MO_02695 [Acidimicrobiales bacterium]
MTRPGPPTGALVMSLPPQHDDLSEDLTSTSDSLDHLTVDAPCLTGRQLLSGLP